MLEEVETTEERMFWSERRASCVEAAQTTRGSGLRQLTGLNPQALAECSRCPPANATG